MSQELLNLNDFDDKLDMKSNKKTPIVTPKPKRPNTHDNLKVDVKFKEEDFSLTHRAPLAPKTLTGNYDILQKYNEGLISGKEYDRLKHYDLLKREKIKDLQKYIKMQGQKKGIKLV